MCNNIDEKAGFVVENIGSVAFAPATVAGSFALCMVVKPDKRRRRNEATGLALAELPYRA